SDGEIMKVSVRGLICTDIAKTTRKWSKQDKHGHGNGKSAQEPEVFLQRSTKSTLGQPTRRQNP
ncbi:hypothetical protein Tco_1063308, partial [Tanacetum coccineum]